MSQKSKSLKRLGGLADAELVKEEGELRQAIWKLKVQRATGQATGPDRLAATKKDLARVLSLRRQRRADGGR